MRSRQIHILAHTPSDQLMQQDARIQCSRPTSLRQQYYPPKRQCPPTMPHGMKPQRQQFKQSPRQNLKIF
jgi:hypothetical protein